MTGIVKREHKMLGEQNQEIMHNELKPMFPVWAQKNMAQHSFVTDVSFLGE